MSPFLTIWCTCAQPENLILRSSPRGLVLVDHGFAVRTDSAEFAPTQRTFELARGTPLYLTQELAQYAVRGASRALVGILYEYEYEYSTSAVVVVRV